DAACPGSTPFLHATAPPIPNMAAMGRTRLSAPALVALVAALIVAGCGSSQTGSVTRTSPPATKTVTRTVASHGSGASSRTDPSGSSTASPSSDTATATSSATGTATANATVTSMCRAAGVKIGYLGGQGATGHGLLGFAIRNTGSSPCTTVGYPGIQFLSKT